MELIHGYFTHLPNSSSSEERYDKWQTVIEKSKCSVSIEEQRIVVSTLVYAVYDLLTEKVNEYKT